MDARTPRRPGRRVVHVGVVGVIALSGVGLASCNRGGDSGTTAAFCAAVQENLVGVRDADFTTLDEARDLLDLYRTVGAEAPLAIEGDWDDLTDSIETALTSDDQQEILATVYAHDQAAAAVHDWVQDNCGFDFGEVVSVLTPAPSIDPSASTTTA